MLVQCPSCDEELDVDLDQVYSLSVQLAEAILKLIHHTPAMLNIQNTTGDWC